MEVKRFSETNDNEKYDIPKPMGLSKSSSNREVYSNTILSQETRKVSTRKPNFTSKVA